MNDDILQFMLAGTAVLCTFSGAIIPIILLRWFDNAFVPVAVALVFYSAAAVAITLIPDGPSTLCRVEVGTPIYWIDKNPDDHKSAYFRLGTAKFCHVEDDRLFYLGIGAVAPKIYQGKIVDNS